jgi:hypothetical protein
MTHPNRSVLFFGEGTLALAEPATADGLPAVGPVR